MPELDETTIPPETATPADTGKPGQRRWPLLAWITVGAVIAVAGAVAGLGATGALIAGGCAAGAGVAGVILWRLPHLRKHFAGPRRASRSKGARPRMGRLLGAGGRKGKLGALGKGKLPRLGKGKLPGTGARGKLLPGGKGRLGKLAGRGKGVTGRTAGRALAGGRRALGRMRKTAGKLLPGGRGGKRGSGGKGKGGGKRPTGRRPGLVRRGGRRLGRIAGAAAVLPLAPLAFLGRRLRARWKKRHAATTPPGRQPPDNETAPPPAPAPAPAQVPARRPGMPLAPSMTDQPSMRRHPVSSQIEQVTEAVHSGIGGFEPQNADDLGEFLKSLPDLYEALASSLNRVADRFGDELPVHPSVTEHLREMASGAAGQQEYAGEAHHIFRTSHEADLERLENPRPGEEFLDASRQ